ncbi:MAG TPA: cell division protein FtsA [Anaerolineales bacterium]|nr:cell division protein FtsA [Anaerolineales bacterium]
MTTPLLTGIDVGTTKVCVLIADLVDDTHYEVLGVGTAPSRGMRKGVVVNVEEAKATIREAVAAAERSAGYEVGTAFVSMAGAHVSCVNSRSVVGVSGSRAIAQDDIDRALDAARAIVIPHNREVLHIIPRNFVVDGQEGIRMPLGMHGFRLEVEAHLITAASMTIKNLTQCIEAAGVMVEQFVLNPLAASEAALTDTERDLGVVACDVGGGTTDVAIFIEGNVWHTAVLPVGGNHITADVAHGLRLPAAAAEEVKIEHGHACTKEVDDSEVFRVCPFGHENAIEVSRAELANVIEARAEEMFDLLLQEIKRSGYDGLLPAGVVLTGGTAQLAGFRQLATGSLGLPVRVSEPRDLRGLVDQVQGPAYSTVVGLLNWALRETMLATRTPVNGHGGNGRHRSNGNSVPGLWAVIGDWAKRLAP